MRRTVIFGDIHGCLGEWKDLLDKVGPATTDRLISVGDLVCKGPHTARTLDFARRLRNLTVVLGNHELRFLRYWHDGDRPRNFLKPYDKRAIREMGARYDDHMRFIASWPHYLDLPEALVVHAGIRPGVPLTRQALEDLTDLRWVGEGARRRPWYESYAGPKPVVFGHWVHREPMFSGHAVGLDSGCVYGGKLSALVLPDWRVVQVRARREYYPPKRDLWSA